MNELLPLHDDHAGLRPAIDALRATADSLSTSTIGELRGTVDSARVYLHSDLLPHLEAEEAVLYPALRQAMGSATATGGMEHDHAQIRALAAEVAEIDCDLDGVEDITPDVANRIRRVFYGLYALLLNHFGKEESIYHPYLQRSLSPGQRKELVAALEADTALRALVATS